MDLHRRGKIMFRVYVSGKMQGRYVWEVQKERAEVIKALSKIGVHAIDPAASETRLFDNKWAKIKMRPTEKVMTALVTQDLWLIRRCDALLQTTGDEISDGSWWEMCLAKSMGIPVIMISPKRATGEFISWSSILIGKENVVASIDKACKLLKRKYLKEYAKHQRYFSRSIKNAKSVSFPKKRRNRNK